MDGQALFDGIFVRLAVAAVFRERLHSGGAARFEISASVQ